MQKSKLLATKFHRPNRPAKWVQRPSLSQRLNEGLELKRKLTLVSAPAGFGKTSCISEWANTLDHPVAWLSLDAGDDDPVRFFTYFVAALQKIDETLGRDIVGVMRSGELPPSGLISATLINDILEVVERFFLVLDDFHIIQDRFILQVFESLIANLPSSLHLVLITREDPSLPLARLRANNLLTDIRAGDLRFTGPDTGRFLDLQGLSLSQADITALEDKTEGWIAGLQLAAIALQSALAVREEVDPSRFISGLSGSHHFVLSYLTEQVLDRQPEEVRQFMLQTAILDKLNGGLCNAVTGRTDGRFLLERLFRANLFLVPLDDEGQWYRYHHLFADLLRDRRNMLKEEETTELHKRASHWYAQADMAGEAIQHALEALDYESAVELLENHAMRLIMQGYVKTVNGWVQSIPDQWRSKSPKTNLAFAWMHLLRGAYTQASPYLDRLEGIFSASEVSDGERQALKAEWLVMQSLLLNMEGKKTESLATATEAMLLTPEDDGRVKSLAYFGLACAYQTVEDDKAAMDAYHMAIQYGRTADNLVVEMLSTSSLAVMAFEKGQLRLANEIAAPVGERLERSASLPPISTVVYGILGEVHYQWGETEQARRYARRAFQLSTLGGYTSGLIGCRVLLSRLSLLEGDLEAAAHEIQKAADQLQADTPDYVRQEVISQLVRVYLARNQLAAAEMALQGFGFSFGDQFTFPSLPLDRSISYSNGLLYNSSLCVLLNQAQSKHNSAGLGHGLELADQLVTRALHGQYLVVALEALLLRAQLHDEVGNHQASMADYASALEMAEPEEIIGVLVEHGASISEALVSFIRENRLGSIQPSYVNKVQAAFSVLKPTGLQPSPDQPAETRFVVLIEPLTERELQVLRLMAKGLKYKETAEMLFISLNTVRFHVKSIYGKLNVNNRTKAIEVAYELQLL